VPCIDAGSLGAAMTQSAVYDVGIGPYWAWNVTGQFFTMRQSGQGQSSAGWIANSDLSLKDNLTPIAGAMAMIRKWTGYTYNRNDMPGNPRMAGLVANEVEDDLPEAVPRGVNGLRCLDHMGPIAVLTNALKEIDERLSHLELQPA
jgi:hypothetical protein